MRKLEHKTEEYMKINPQGKIPSVQEIDSKTGQVVSNMYESHTIMRYLADSRGLDEKWYPRNDLRKRAKVDEYLDSHHLMLRGGIGHVVFKKVHAPLLFG